MSMHIIRPPISEIDEKSLVLETPVHVFEPKKPLERKLLVNQQERNIMWSEGRTIWIPNIVLK